MPTRYRDRRERREPEKTPLIDMIFLLLIFFFVTVVGANFIPEQQPEEVKTDLELLPMNDPTEPAPDSLDNEIVIQIQLVKDVPALDLERCNELIKRVNATKGLDRREPVKNEEAEADDFLVFIFDKTYPDFESLLDKLETDLQSYQQDRKSTTMADVETALIHLPITLPDGATAEKSPNLYKTAISEFTNRLNELAPLSDELNRSEIRNNRIHLRMEPTLYMKFINDLFEICNQQNINVENLKLRVLKQRRG
jgi:biopolymer transport protein ExbD